MKAKQIFLIEDKNRTALFMPLKGLILEVKVDEKEKVHELIERSDFLPNDITKLFPEIDLDRLYQGEVLNNDGDKDGVCPTSLVLFTTLDCNLRCIYCYSKAGEQKKNMDWQTAKTAIDFIVQNAKLKGKKEAIIELHGGGEPTWNWPVFKTAISYFQEMANQNALSPKINLATNGMLSRKRVEWIATHINSVQVSLDGMPEIQNYQRPTAKGAPSFSVVYNAIKSFMALGVQPMIRCTIAEKGIDKIPEITQFFAENFPGNPIHFEPVCECGRGLQTGQKFPSTEIFIRKFIEADEIAKSIGIEISYSGARQNLTELRRSFCGACVPNFIVAPDGIVSACHEISENTHPLADYFIYGQLEYGNFVFDNKKIEKIKDDSARIKSHCVECFAQYHCAGECLAKNLMSDDGINTRCRINQELMRHYIFKRLFRKEVTKDAGSR